MVAACAPGSHDRCHSHHRIAVVREQSHMRTVEAEGSSRRGEAFVHCLPFSVRFWCLDDEEGTENQEPRTVCSASARGAGGKT